LVTVGIVGNVELEWHSMPSLKDKSWALAVCRISSPRSVVMAFFKDIFQFNWLTANLGKMENCEVCG
jgi:hypothetical protein